MIYPISYGADPTGGQDSSDAILEALTDAFQLQTELNMLPRVADLGGVVIDLQGGSYKIGKPLRFPSSGGGNLLVSPFRVFAYETCKKKSLNIYLYFNKLDFLLKKLYTKIRIILENFE